MLSDESFARRGIGRRNQQRTALEHAAQAVRTNAPVKSYRVDAQQPTFTAPAPHVSRSGSGGGAIDREMLLLITALSALAAWRYLRRAHHKH